MLPCISSVRKVAKMAGKGVLPRMQKSPAAKPHLLAQSLSKLQIMSGECLLFIQSVNILSLVRSQGSSRNS